ncbi:MAG: hypothetical protein ACI8Y7_000208 [Candidatus Woesearchaeota archaeon]|jgi:hypothetical protein
MGKKLKITLWIIGIIILLILITGIYLFRPLGVDPAKVTVQFGDVFVDTGNGYEKITSVTTLKETDSIKTENGSATIILYESVFQTLDPYSEITIKELTRNNPKTIQKAGTTWTKFTALSGVETFETDTPNGVAIARGTGYEIQPSQILVLEGTVEAQIGGKTILIADGEAYSQVDGAWNKRPLTVEEKERLSQRVEINIKNLQELRLSLKDKYKQPYNLAKKIKNFSDDDLVYIFADIDSGEINIDAELEKFPIKHELFTRVADISKQILTEKEILEQLSTT